ncbi:hypothetical protein K7432_014065 [Basidiobolus ranarum]|uniref:SMP-LTD domain-containing protein n=1 Tax=Basidiobolus ranarum TaxID=34480 RepID=A0ABR2WI72_9FUNG
MAEVWSLAVAFVSGGAFLTPLIFVTITLLLVCWWKTLTSDTSPSLATRFEPLSANFDQKLQNGVPTLNSNSGWIRMTKEFKVDQEDSNIISELMMQGINSLIEGKNAGPKRPKDSYFAVLKHETLSLYADEKMLECQGVITLSFYTVSLCPSYLPDNEVFLEELPIRLKKKIVEDHTVEDVKRDYYIFIDTPIEKEEWFFALCRASRLKQWGTTHALFDQNPANFEPTAMLSLIEKVHSDEHHRQTQWLNAFVGRVFLAVYKTQAIKDFVTSKILLKCSKIPRPSFIQELTVKDLLLGDNVPSVTHPKLIDLNANGEMSAEFRVHYNGGFAIEIETALILTMPPFISSFTIPVKIAIRVKTLKGRMLLKVKPPPTNRLWLGFIDDPNISFDIVPIVSGKIIQSKVILKIIESQIRTVLKEVMVLPNMDDTEFFPSEGLGGIFNSAGIIKVQRDVAPQSETEHSMVDHNELKTPTELFEYHITSSNDHESEHSESGYAREIDEGLAIAAQMPLEIPLNDSSYLTASERGRTVTSAADGPTANPADVRKTKSTEDFSLEGGLPNVTAVTRGYAMAKNTDLKDSNWWRVSKDPKRNSFTDFISGSHSGDQPKEPLLNETLGKIKLLPTLMSIRNSTWGNTNSKEGPLTSDTKSDSQTSKTNDHLSFMNSPALSSITSIFSQNNSSSISPKKKVTKESEESTTSESGNTSITSVQPAKFFTSLFSHSST